MVANTLMYAWQYGIPIVLSVFGIFLLIQPRLNQQNIGQLKSKEAIPSSNTLPVIDSTPFPDWPIRELFFYLRPDLVDDHKKNLWEKVGLEIRDNLSVGRLLIWGRKRDALPGKRSNFSLIPPEYWKPEVDFTYWFLDDSHQHACHVDPPTKLGLPGYSDLHVNKAQAIKIWSGKENKDAALLRLTQLRGEGVVIRNAAAKIYYTNHLDAWSRSVTDWMREVIETLKTVSAADSEWFATLDTVGPARVQVPIRLTGQADISMLVSTYNQHDLRLVRLENLLKKYGIAA